MDQKEKSVSKTNGGRRKSLNHNCTAPVPPKRKIHINRGSGGGCPCLVRLAGLGQNSADLLGVWPDSKSSYVTEASSPCESSKPCSPPTPTPSIVGAQIPVSSSAQDIVGAQSLVPTRALWELRALSPPHPRTLWELRALFPPGPRVKLFSSGLYSVCEQVFDSNST